MLIGAILAAVGLLGWIVAWRQRRRALMAEAMARFTEERHHTIDMVSERIRINEATARSEAAAALERAAAERSRAATLQLQVEMLNADIEAMKARVAQPSEDEFFDSSTKRLKKFPSLAAKPDV